MAKKSDNGAAVMEETPNVEVVAEAFAKVKNAVTPEMEKRGFAWYDGRSRFSLNWEDFAPEDVLAMKPEPVQIIVATPGQSLGVYGPVVTMPRGTINAKSMGRAMALLEACYFQVTEVIDPTIGELVEGVLICYPGGGQRVVVMHQFDNLLVRPVCVQTEVVVWRGRRLHQIITRGGKRLLNPFYYGWTNLMGFGGEKLAADNQGLYEWCVSSGLEDRFYPQAPEWSKHAIAATTQVGLLTNQDPVNFVMWDNENGKFYRDFLFGFHTEYALRASGQACLEGVINLYRLMGKRE